MDQLQENQATHGETELQNASKESDDISQNAAPVESKAPGYAAQNSELDSFLNEATTTKAEVFEQEKADKLAESKQMQPEEAAALAVQGMAQVVNLAREYTGKNLEISANHLQLGAVLFVPAIMKYGPIVQNYIEDMAAGVDGDSNLPEYMAAGGVAALGGVLWWQSRKEGPKPPAKSATKKTKPEKGKADGD